MHALTPASGNAGFTLIELLVVILIIGILAAIGIPALLSQRDKAKNTAAKSGVRTALAAVKTIYTEDDNFDDVNADSIERVEPTLYAGSPHEPSDAQRPGDDAEPKNIWIGDGVDQSNPGVRGSDSEIVTLCSISKGNSIACIYNDEGTGNVRYLEAVGGRNGVDAGVLSPSTITGQPMLKWPTAATIAGDAF